MYGETDAPAVLIVVDVQNSFVDGAPAVPHGEEVVPVINSITRFFANVVLTLDWHPAGLAAAQAFAAPAAGGSVDLLVLGPDGAIAVNGNAIVWMGKASDAAKMFKAKNTVQAAGQIAMPGMTDTHYHTAQQFLRGVHRTTHRKGPSWKKILIPFESGLDEHDVYNSDGYR